MQAHKTVSREEWLEARRALLAKEKDLLKRQGRAAPRDARDALGEGRQGLCVRRAGRQGDARRPVRRPQPADRQALHAGTRLEAGLPRLLVRRRPGRRPARPPDQPRRHVRRRLARALPRDRRPSTSAWAGTSSGCRRSARTSTSTTTSPSPRRTRRAARCSTTSRRWTTRATSCRASACSTKDEAGQIFHTYSMFSRGTD